MSIINHPVLTIVALEPQRPGPKVQMNRAVDNPPIV